MEIVYSDTELEHYMKYAVELEPDRPILIDQFLENAVEVDVDALADKDGNVVIGGIMEHIEHAGIHSGDSACSLPSQTLTAKALETIRTWTIALAKRLNVIGLMNVQYATQGDTVYIIEANPRASRTVPFVAKSIGRPLAKLASLVMSGKTLSDVGLTEEVIPEHVAVKEAVLPFNKFPNTDTLLGPEMRSTGEVMGLDSGFGKSFAKAEQGAGETLPLGGTAFVSVIDRDKQGVVEVVKELQDLGFAIVATSGTYKALKAAGIEENIESVLKISEGRPHVLDIVKNQQIQLIVNTPSGGDAQLEGRSIRRAALGYKIPIVTTLAGARATTAAIRALQAKPLEVKALQDYFA